MRPEIPTGMYSDDGEDTDLYARPHNMTAPPIVNMDDDINPTQLKALLLKALEDVRTLHEIVAAQDKALHRFRHEVRSVKMELNTVKTELGKKVNKRD